MSPFKDIKEVAEHLKVCGRTVRRLIKAGKLRAHKIGGVYRIKIEELEKYIAASTVKVPGKPGRPPGRPRIDMKGIPTYV